MTADEMTKRCTHCKSDKPAMAFGRDKNRKDGRHPWCKECCSEAGRKIRATPTYREKNREYQRAWAQRPERKSAMAEYQQTPAGKAAKRRTKLKAKYGLTEAAYQAILDAQGGVCDVCRSSFRASKHTHVDHCHKTGRVRGILCHNCNRALGAVNDNTLTLTALTAYLRRHS